jgi:hypothetical protein
MAVTFRKSLRCRGLQQACPMPQMSLEYQVSYKVVHNEMSPFIPVPSGCELCGCSWLRGLHWPHQSGTKGRFAGRSGRRGILALDAHLGRLGLHGVR